jgi:hypothetical protein
MFSIIAAIIGGFFSSGWRTLFPPKTAADQRSEDLTATVKDANNALKTSQAVARESLADVESDLDKRVRDPHS